MLSNAYFLAKFRFDTAENEPAKNLQNLLIILPILLTLTPNPYYPSAARAPRRARGGATLRDGVRPERVRRRGRPEGVLHAGRD